MKQIVGILPLAALLVTPSLAMAEGQTGFYVAPRIGYGLTQMNGIHAEAEWRDGEEVAKGNKSDNTFGGALAVGYGFQKKFQLPVRAELEYAAFSKASGKTTETYYYNGVLDWRDTVKLDLNINTLFMNAYYDFSTNTGFTPYVGAGFGLAFVSAKGVFGWESWDFGYFQDSIKLGKKSTTNFAWNIGFGAAYSVTDSLSVDLGYRFAGLGKAKTKSALDSWDERNQVKTKDIYMHQLMLGLRFAF